MAPLARRRFDDEDVLDDFDPAYFPKRVYKDGRGPRVALMLTDAAPPHQRRAVFDARNHQPHYAVVDQADPHVRDAERAYYERSKMLQDAWRGPANQPPPDDDGDDELSPRDQYIARLQTAYRTPIGNGNGTGADAIEAQRRRWTAESPTKDAALADRDIAYGEYLDYLQNAWKRPSGVVAGGRR